MISESPQLDPLVEPPPSVATEEAAEIAARVYVDFLDSDDDASRVREAYGDQIYRRLAEVKAKYDPDSAFHHNKNIRPG